MAAKTKRGKEPVLMYPYNIIELLETQTGGKYHFTAKSVLDLIDDALTEREKQVLEMRWRDMLTLKQAGCVFNVTSERIRQVEAKAFRKLRHPSRMARFSVVPYMEYLRVVRKLEVTEAALKASEERVACLYRHEEDPSPTETDDARLSEPIENLDLSVRAFNSLYRGGYSTIGDVVKLARENKLLNVRNLGQKCAREIKEKLRVEGLL